LELIKVKTGTSLFYYVYLVLCIGAAVGLYFLLRKKSQKVQYWTLFGILAFNFVLHFFKLVFPQYTGFPAVIRKCSFENICAVSTLVFPFMYISKSKVCKDYMFYLGLISGIAGCLAPMPVASMDLEFWQPETMRYYICHAGIWIVPLLMVVLGIHKLNYHRIYKALCIYFLVLGVIIVNELILIRIGWVETSTLEDFFSANERDMGYAIGLPDSMQGAGKFVLWLTPKAWKDPYVPILWELIPVLTLGALYCLLISLIWEHEHFKNDMIFLKNKTVELWGKLKTKISEMKQSRAAKNGEAPEKEQGEADKQEEQLPPENSENSKNIE